MQVKQLGSLDRYVKHENSPQHKATRRNLKEKMGDLYTRLSDVEDELLHTNYTEAMRGACIISPCDAEWSAFRRFAKKHMVDLGIKKWVFTHYEGDKWNAMEYGNANKTYAIELLNNNGELLERRFTVKRDAYTLNGTTVYDAGDFRSNDVISLIKEADIVITNPPFALWGQLIKVIDSLNKNYVLIGKNTAMSEPLTSRKFMSGDCNIGWAKSSSMSFYIPLAHKTSAGKNILLTDDELYKLRHNGSGFKAVSERDLQDIAEMEAMDGFKHKDQICKKWVVTVGTYWYTNLKPSTAERSYKNVANFKNMHYYGNENFYSKMDDLDALYVDRVDNLPVDYYEPICISTGMFEHWNREEYKLLGFCCEDRQNFGKRHYKGTVPLFRCVMQKIKGGE